MKRKWVLPAVAGALTTLWVVMSLPHVENVEDDSVPYTVKRAGWPDYFARWGVAKDTGKTIYSSFSEGKLLFDLVTLAVPIGLTWVILRHLRPPQDPDAARTKRSRGTTPSHTPPAPPPPRRPPGPSRASGGWG